MSDVNVQELDEKHLEVLVQKGFGGSEQVTVKVITTRESLKQDVDRVYADVLTPRADTFAKEVADYQIEMDRANAEIAKNDTVFEERVKHGRR